MIDLMMDPDRLTFIARRVDGDEPSDLEEAFEDLMGLGIADAFDTPEHQFDLQAHVDEKRPMDDQLK